MSIAATRAQTGTPARGWNLSSFTGVNACAPVPVVVKPAADNATYAVSIYGDAAVANSLNAYVKDGQVYVENTAPFNTANPVGIVLTMPSDKLEAVYNRGTGGSASLTAISGFTPSTMTVDTIPGSGPTVLGINNATSSIYVSHASSSDLRISGSIGTVDFSTRQTLAATLPSTPYRTPPTSALPQSCRTCTSAVPRTCWSRAPLSAPRPSVTELAA